MNPSHSAWPSRNTFWALAIFCGGAISGAGQDNEAAARASAQAWNEVPHILARKTEPVFPDREFVITNYGAVGDGAKDCTPAFRDAIQACSQAGGGRVEVPPGKFLTGAIHLKSNVNLHVAKDATILFSTNPKDFLPVVFSRDVAEMMNYSPFIYAFEQENIAVTGEGILDGQATKSVWPAWSQSEGGHGLADRNGGQRAARLRAGAGRGPFPAAQFYRARPLPQCARLGVQILDSPMWELHPLYCTNVTVRGVSIHSHGKNNNGCDPDSCSDVWIKDCLFDTGDDCIAVKAGRGHDGRRVNIPCQNIVIQNCEFKDGHGGVTMGSETPAAFARCLRRIAASTAPTSTAPCASRPTRTAAASSRTFTCGIAR